MAMTKNCASFFVRIVGTLVVIARGGGGDVQTARRIRPEVSSRANLSTGIQRKSKYLMLIGPPLTHAYDSSQYFPSRPHHQGPVDLMPEGQGVRAEWTSCGLHSNKPVWGSMLVVKLSFVVRVVVEAGFKPWVNQTIFLNAQIYFFPFSS